VTNGEHRTNPYVGLRPYFIADSLYFFGRDEQVVELLEILHAQRLLGVVGSSGSGKSSLVRAGLLPALLGGFLVEDRDRWRIVQLKPGDAPIGNLASELLEAFGSAPADAERAAFARAIDEGHTEAVLEFLRPRLEANSAVFLLVDQFEEVFAFRSNQGAAGETAETPIAWTGTFTGTAHATTQSLDEADAARRREGARRRAEAADFVDLLLALAKQRELPIYVALTMRTDFLGDCDLFFGLPEALNRGRYLVPRMTRQQLAKAIAGPPRLLGQRMAPRLLDHLLNELGDRFDRLPVLQHALLRTWDAWVQAGGYGFIDLEHFAAAGALERALEQDAELALSTVSAASAERVLRALTDTDISQRQVRRPCRMNELATAAGIPRDEVEQVVAAFRSGDRNFLYTANDGEPGDPRVDISHESLIRQWPRLSAWVEAERDARTVYRRLVGMARSAEAGERDLMTEREFAIQSRSWQQIGATAGWAARYSAAPDDFEVTSRFVTRSGEAIEAAKAEQNRQEQAAVHERRQRRRARVLGTTTLVVLLSAGLAFVMRQSSVRQQTITDAGAVVGFVSRIHAALEPIPGTGDVRRELLENAEGLKARLGVGSTGGLRVPGTEFWELLQQGDVALRGAARDSARALYGAARNIAVRESASGNRVWRRNRIIAEQNLGDLERGANRPDSARAHYMAALELSRTQVAADRADTQAERDMASAWSSVGDLEMEQGRMPEAGRAYTAVLQIIQPLAAGQSAERLEDLLLATRRLAEWDVRMGAMDSARVRFAATRAIAERLAVLTPGNTQVLADLSAAYGSLGELEKNAGRFDSARTLHAKSLDYALSLAADPGGHLTAGYTRLGDLEAAAGNAARAVAWYTRALELEERMARVGADAAARRTNLLLTYNRLGELALGARQRAAARDWYGKTVTAGEALGGAAGGNRVLIHALWVAYTGLGDVASDDRQPAAARESYTKALALAEPLAKSGSADAGLDLWTSLKNMGDAARDARDRQAAFDWYTRAAATIESLARAHPDNDDLQRDLAISTRDLSGLKPAAVR
jgi:tetratricopeptide (TPR) repeat protein